MVAGEVADLDVKGREEDEGGGAAVRLSWVVGVVRRRRSPTSLSVEGEDEGKRRSRSFR